MAREEEEAREGHTGLRRTVARPNVSWTVARQGEAGALLLLLL